ncbi:DUF1697 domain-containing protein [Tunturiibacter gelidiferens]|uniref:DUF1697 domain-containing protein n=1 Tax=Tunturiibacter gelidiferens TaxID=3069689 RepID=UPI003D9ACB1A
MMKDRAGETALRYVALMRGVNVGGKNMVPMKDLVGIFAAAGCGDVVTYIQSGNVVFRADDKVVKRLESVIAKKVEERFGFKVPVVLRTASEMEAVVRGIPFEGASCGRDAACFFSGGSSSKEFGGGTGRNAITAGRVCSDRARDLFEVG